MANERNVEALAAIMRGLPLAPLAEYEIGPWIPQLAEVLASRGVLVPSALTDAEAYRVRESESGIREELERIARGD